MFRAVTFRLIKPTVIVVFVLDLIVRAELAQSLVIHLEGTNKISLEATSPLNLAYRVQATVDAENWLDVSDQASGSYTYWIDPTVSRDRLFRLRIWETADLPMTLVILGDSTVADFSSNMEQFYGWGQGLYDYFKPNLTIVNLATPAQSSLTFLGSSQRDALVLIKPDFVLVQFGLQDDFEDLGLPGLSTSLEEYEANLKTIVRMIRDFQGTPVLVTPLLPGYFDLSGKVMPFLKDRSAVVRKVSAELQTYLIDLNQLSEDYFNKIGPTEGARLTWSATNKTHFSLAGAEVIAGIVVNALPAVLSAQIVKTPALQ
jgi:lysophospholipase L1-like esterase